MTDAQLTIKLVSSSSETLAITVPNLESATVLSLKQLVEARDAQRFPVAAQRLIFQGQILQNDKTLSEYNVASGCALHLTLTPGVAARPAPAPVPVVGSGAGSSSAVETQLRAFLQQMRGADSGYVTAIQTMQKICENVINNPHEDKYRKLRLGNAALKNRLLDRVRGVDCVKLLGFQEGVEADHLVLVPTAEKWEYLVTGKRVLDEAVAASSSGFNGAPSPFAAPPAFGAGAGVAAPGGNNSNWASQAQSMLQNPMMAQMLQNDPMMQQMAQMNPMVAQALQNPSMLSQQLQMLQQNPAMMQQVNQLMQDPSAMARVQQMMGGGGGGAAPFGGFGGGGFGGSPFGAAAPTSASANPFAPSAPAAASNPFASAAPAPVSVSVSAPAPASTPAPAPAASASTAPTTEDDASFDEDEIADAIARSLQDHA